MISDDKNTHKVLDSTAIGSAPIPNQSQVGKIQEWRLNPHGKEVPQASTHKDLHAVVPAFNESVVVTTRSSKTASSSLLRASPCRFRSDSESFSGKGNEECRPSLMAKQWYKMQPTYRCCQLPLSLWRF